MLDREIPEGNLQSAAAAALSAAAVKAKYLSQVYLKFNMLYGFTNVLH